MNLGVNLCFHLCFMFVSRLHHKNCKTKANINNRGYNKYLKLEGEIDVKIDQEKFNHDAIW